MRTHTSVSPPQKLRLPSPRLRSPTHYHNCSLNYSYQSPNCPTTNFTTHQDFIRNQAQNQIPDHNTSYRLQSPSRVFSPNSRYTTLNHYPQPVVNNLYPVQVQSVQPITNTTLKKDQVVVELEKKIKYLELKIEQQKVQILEYQKGMIQKDSDIQQQRNMSQQQLQNEINKYQQDIQKYQQELQQKSGMIQALETSLKNHHVNHEKYQKKAIEDISLLKEILQKKEEEIHNYENEKQELQSENKIWQDNYEKVEQSYNIAQQQANQRIQDLTEKHSELFNLQMNEKNNVEYLQNENQNLQQEIQNQQMVIEDMKIQIKAISKNQISSNDVKHYEEELASFRIKHKEFVDKINTQEKEKYEYKNQLNFLKNENEQLRQINAEIAVNQQTLQKYDQQLTFFKAENQRLNNIIVGRCREMRENW